MLSWLMDIQVYVVLFLNSLHMCFPDCSVGRESASMQETWVRSLGWEHPLEEGKATHSMENSMDSPWVLKESDTAE